MLRYFSVFNFKFDDMECEVIQLHICKWSSRTKYNENASLLSVSKLYLNKYHVIGWKCQIVNQSGSLKAKPFVIGMS